MSSPDPTARSRRPGLPLALARPIASLARLVSRATGREGAALPGKVLLTLAPGALAKMANAGRRRGRKIVLVSATNGKTTTTALLVELLRASGLDVVTNVTGANLRSGIATTLMQAGRRGDVAVLETDEATLPLVAPDLKPDMIVLGNLFRDQLDRFGELEVLADRWRDTLAELDPTTTTIAYNTDDPLISELVNDHVERAIKSGAMYSVLPFGLADESVGQDGLPHAADSRFCRRCGHALEYRHSWVGHLGAWHCENCGAQPELAQTCADNIELDGLAATNMLVRFDAGESRRDFQVRLPIPGLYNVYNAIAALAAADLLVDFDFDDPRIAETISSAEPAFGRFERIPVPSGGTITLLLVKNPTGLNEVIRTLVESGVDLTATLFALNDQIADGRDTSWIWDADVEPLLERAGAMVVTGERAAEFGLRAVYGGLDPAGVLLEPDLEQAMYRVLERAREFTEHGHAYALVTYTAMLRMRAVIAAQGWARAYWANEPRKRSRR
jgi:UDP-N-acetylmuramyl tripeptide synthase